MPKAAIHKNGDSEFWENEIWFAEDALVTPPARDAVLAEKYYQSQLGVLVATAADARHHVASLGFGENVRHDSDYHLLDRIVSPVSGQRTPTKCCTPKFSRFGLSSLSA
jgi:hypothetical protein